MGATVIYFTVITVVAAEMSAIVSIWLLVKLSSLPQCLRERLFPKQLQYLAVADAVFSLFAIPTNLVDNHALASLDTQTLHMLCRWSMVLLEFGRHLSLCFEMHVALSLLLLSFRYSVSVHLHGSLAILPLLCLFLTAISLWYNPWHYDLEGGTCSPVNWLVSADLVSLTHISLCMGVCAVSYTLVFYRNRSRQSPASVQASVSRRAEMYVLNALLTYGLIFVVYLSRRMFDSWSVRFLAETMENLGGCLNAATYAFLSRYGTVMHGEDPSVIPIRSCAHEGASCRRPSFRVDLGGVLDVVEFSPHSLASVSSHFLPDVA